MRLKSRPAVAYRYELIVRLHQQAHSQCHIASVVNCSQAWVSKLLKRYNEQGPQAFTLSQGPRGRPPALEQHQLQALSQMLLQGALHYGFATDNWTRERIAQLVATAFKVNHHPAHISRLMLRIGFSLQKPMRRSYKKDPQAVSQWRQQTLPELKKKGT